MAELGINADGRAGIAPESLAALGATWVRCVAYPEDDISDWIRSCHDHGVRVLLVLASESIGTNPNLWNMNITEFRDRYWGLVDAWQLANEPDHVSPSSWTMDPEMLSMLLRMGRDVLGWDAYIVGAGLASGQPSWAWDVEWGPCSAIACHPYAKDPGSPELDWMLGEYSAIGKPLWVTEYHARSIGMAAALRDDWRVQVALAFCWSDSMVPGFGLIEDYRALNDFVQATGGPLTPPSRPPAERHAEYVLGFRKWHNLEPALLGEPLKNERNVAPEWQIQPTDRGTLCWVGGKGHAFVQHDGRVWRWNEDSPASWEVPE